MAPLQERSNEHDPYGLQRFIEAQEQNYDDAFSELQHGRKRTHWMWYIFPQIDGLGMSSTTKHFAIKSAEEARQYLAHPVLGKRLHECAEIVLATTGRSAHDIFGSPDDMKLHSSMSLFAAVQGKESVFQQVLDKYFGGKDDQRTAGLLQRLG